MLNTTLPIMLDLRQAAMRGVVISGVLKPLDLKRFRPLLAGDEGVVSSEIHFSRDDERRHLMCVAIAADVVVTCQRCLDTMSVKLSSESTLAIVWTDEEAAHLPKHLESIVVADALSNLWDVVEEELILALPPYSYHETEDCNLENAAFSDPVSHGETSEQKPNPFNVLAQLKPGDKS